MMKLLQYSTKLKEVYFYNFNFRKALSAYKEEKIFIENLYEGDDFTSFIERTTLEEIIEKNRDMFI